MLNIAIFLFRAPVFCSFLEGICPFFLSSRGTKSEVSPLLSSSFPGPRRPVISHSLAGPRIVVRGDPVRRGIQKYPPGHSALPRHTALRRGIQEYRQMDPASWCGVTRCDAESRNTLPVIPRYDAVLHVIPRYDAVSRKYPPLDPASLCGVTHATGPRIVVRGDSRHWTPHRGAG